MYLCPCDGNWQTCEAQTFVRKRGSSNLPLDTIGENKMGNWSLGKVFVVCVLLLLGFALLGGYAITLGY